MLKKFVFLLVVVSAVVFSEKAFASEYEFECNAPFLGSEYCGKESTNFRISPGVSISIDLQKSDGPRCVTFILENRAGKELARATVCTDDTELTTIWKNKKSESVDVAFYVKTRVLESSSVSGKFYFEKDDE